MAMVSSKMVDILCTILLHLLPFLIKREQCVRSKFPSTANFPLQFIIILKLFKSYISTEKMAMVSSKIVDIVGTILLDVLAFPIEVEQSTLMKFPSRTNFP